MALVQKIQNSVFTDTTIAKLYRDSVVTDGTLLCYDFADDTSWVKQDNKVEGDIVYDLTELGNDGVSLAIPQNFISKGIEFDLSPNEGFQLPSVANLTSNTGGFLVVIWLTQGAQTQATGGAIAGYRNGTSGTWGIRWENPTFRLLVNGQEVNKSLSNEVHQIGIAWVDVGGGVFEHRVYIDGVLDSSVTATHNTMQTVVTPPTYPVLGEDGGTGYNNYWLGKVHRFFIEDLGVSSSDPLAIIEKDYLDNSTRFI